MHSRFLKHISFILASGLLLTSTAFAAPLNWNYNNSASNSTPNISPNAGQESNTSDFGNAQNYMIHQGIMKGDGNGNYNMSGNIKRGDMAIMMVRAFQLSSNSTGNFSDITSNSYYYDATATLKNLGIAQGDGRNFNPDNYVTLEQVILFIERAVTNSGVATYSDLDLRALYSDEELSAYATREDVADLLYYILTGDTSGADTSTSGNSIDTVSYSVDSDDTVTFDSDDFADAFADAAGDDLYCVKFTLPSSAYGTLYYEYTSSSDYDSKVSATKKYYADESPSLSDVTFVPKSTYDGTLSIPYTAYNEDGDAYTGTVKITVNGEAVDIDTVSYSVDSDDTVTFDSDDFADAFADATGDDLYYVKFTLPSSVYGTLYYDYTSSSDYDSRVSATKKYYADESPSLSGVTFVPKSTYDGTLSIPYTAYNEDGDAYTGTVEITVNEV